LKKVFSIDLRSIALVRIFLGLVTFFYFFERIPYATAFYSHKGIIGVSEMDLYFGPIEKFNLFYYFGSPTFALFIFLSGMILSLCFALGYRTKVVNIIIWIFLLNIQSRFPLSMNGGDVLLPLLFLWSYFLPMEKVASWDRGYFLDEREEIKKFEFSGLSVAAWIIQVVLIYVTTALFKWHPYWHSTGEALHFALHLDTFTTSLGRLLLRAPSLLPLMSIGTFLLELIGPLLLLIPFKRNFMRPLSVVLFIGFHLGISATFSIGLFPYICISMWLIFIPGSFWDALTRRPKKTYTVFYDKDCSYCKRMVNLIKTFFLDQEIVRRRSWAGRDEEGEVYFAWENFLMILKQSGTPFFFFLFSLVPKGFGKRTYDFVAKRRAYFAPFLKFVGAGGAKSSSLILKRVKLGFLTFFMLMGILFNATGFESLKKYKLTGYAHNAYYLFGLDQRWDMFSPFPATMEGWPVLSGKLTNGKKFDPWRKKNVSFERPRDLKAEYPSGFWRKVWERLSSSNYSGYRGSFVRYICREWNQHFKDPDKKLQSIRLYYMREHSPRPGQNEARIEKSDLGSFGCGPS
jgi:predicted DCC family thiol-disulfide oxidoreductase YuxK